MISGVDPTPPIWLGAGGAYWISILLENNKENFKYFDAKLRFIVRFTHKG